MKRKIHPHANDGTLNVFWVPADVSQPTEYKPIDRGIDAMQKLVGGYVEPIYRLFDSPRLDCGCYLMMLVNENAPMMGWPSNPRLADLYPWQEIKGDVLFVANGPVENTEGSRDFVSLPPQFFDWDLTPVVPSRYVIDTELPD